MHGAIAGSTQRNSLRRRDSGYPEPPAQSRTCSFPASGSSVVLAFALAISFMQTPAVHWTVR
jgi:hypothetical protein